MSWCCLKKNDIGGGDYTFDDTYYYSRAAKVFSFGEQKTLPVIPHQHRLISVKLSMQIAVNVTF